MAKYNSNLNYNKIMGEGGAMYNNSLFFTLIRINDNAYIGDSSDNIKANLSILDDVLVRDNKTVIADISVNDEGYIKDNKIVMASISIDDKAYIQEDKTIKVSLELIDKACIKDEPSNVYEFNSKDYFLVTDDNILEPLGVLITNDSRHELLPATRDNIEEIAGIDGELDFGSFLKARTLELDVTTSEYQHNINNPLDKMNLQRLFARYLNPKNGIKKLVFLNDIDKTYFVKYSGSMSVTNYPNWFRFTIPFKMSNPYIMGTIEHKQTGSGHLTNNGNVDTGLIIEIKGPASTPSLVIGNKILRYNGSLSNNDILIIDTEKQTVKINNTNALDNYNKVFPMLQIGETKLIAENNVIVKWRNKWI